VGSLRRNGGVCTGSAFAVDGKASIELGENRFGIKALPWSEDR
jgi:hypothetical protein